MYTFFLDLWLLILYDPVSLRANFYLLVDTLFVLSKNVCTFVYGLACLWGLLEH